MLAVGCAKEIPGSSKTQAGVYSGHPCNQKEWTGGKWCAASWRRKRSRIKLELTSRVCSIGDSIDFWHSSVHQLGKLALSHWAFHGHRGATAPVYGQSWLCHMSSGLTELIGFRWFSVWGTEPTKKPSTAAGTRCLLFLFFGAKNAACVDA